MPLSNCKCDMCNVSFYKEPGRILRSKNNFCSLACSARFRDKRVEVICMVCGKIFLKELYEIGRRKRNCCSKDCSILLGKFHKNWGSKRSKLEVAIEAHISKMFMFEIRYNKTEIGYELDLHVPHLNLAIELNGVFHYKAIYGEKKLLRTQQNDRDKAAECLRRDIKLIVINVSKDGRSKKIQNQRIEEVVKYITDRMQELSTNKKSDQLVLDF